MAAEAVVEVGVAAVVEAVVDRVIHDRVGIGWRPELAAGILTNLDRVDVVEVIADDLFTASKRELRAMQTLAAQIPVALHGVSLGLASSSAVDVARLEQMARVVNVIEPELWSEHLAFVRSAGLEIGHLAAPPRTEATIDGTACNVARAAQVVGTAPLLENVATLIEPPGSTLDEAAWITSAVSATNGGLLLDLNNLYSNAVNFRCDPSEMLRQLPLSRVQAVHLAGGKWISATNGEKRLLDDHLHDVPDEVYELLAELGANTNQPLTVILERDGSYPAFSELVQQLDLARAALASGRARKVPALVLRSDFGAPRTPQRVPSQLEDYLVRLYLDVELRRRFLSDPDRVMTDAGLDAEVRGALANIDRVGLELAAHSFFRKRMSSRVE